MIDFEKRMRDKHLNREISVQDFLDHAKHIGMTREEAYEMIEENRKSLENPQIPYAPLYTIMYTTDVSLSEKAWEEIKESWGDEW